jgi:prophage antirepressor-like protein
MNNEIVRIFDGYDVRVKEKEETWFRANDLGRILFPESSDPGNSINKLINLIKNDYEKQFGPAGINFPTSSEADSTSLDPSSEAVPYDPEIEELLPRQTKLKEKQLSGSKYVSYINETMVQEVLFRTNSPIALKFKVFVFKVLKDVEKHRLARGKGIDTRKRLTSAIKRRFPDDPNKYSEVTGIVNDWSGLNFINDRDKLGAEKLRKVKTIEDSISYLFENRKDTRENFEALERIFND